MRALMKWWPWVRVNPNARRWVWTPVTYRFAHGGWVYLSPSWFRRFWRGTQSAKCQGAASDGSPR